jgi:solute carrier family 9B (sodium/hydrogen exchanger), member 1/2
MTAVAPAVVVPLMIGLIKEGYGLIKLIPVKIIASATVENVTILVIFGIFSGIGLQ